MSYNIVHSIYSALPDWFKNNIRTLVWKFHITKESRKLSSFYSKIIKKGDLVFDLGTNYGNHTSIFLELGARVICLEPNPNIINGLNTRFKSNNVEIINKGVSSKSEVLPFRIFKNSGHNTFEDYDRSTRQKLLKIVNIQTTTLEDLIKEYGVPNFIKIDVEGFEYNVLKSLKQKAGGISFEFHTSEKNKMKNCINYLKDIGYKDFNFSYKNNYQFELSHWTRDPINLIMENCGDIYARA